MDSLLLLVSDELERVDQLVHSSLRSTVECVQRLIDHASQFRGKRLRPAMVVLAGQAHGRVSPEHLQLGAVVELIHMATLLHDDVLDEATTRRRMPTLNSMHGNLVPILLGDIVYATAFTLANEIPDNTASRVLSKITATICAGEIQQNFSRGRLDLTLEEYYAIIEAKTASLYAACGSLGAHYAGASPQDCEALYEYGRCVGMAFQIIDDCLDLIGDESRVGKSLGTDLDEGKMTLPLIHLVQRSSPEDRKALKALLEDPTLENRRSALCRRFDLEPDLGHALLKAQEFVRGGVEKLQSLRDTPAKDAFLRLGDYVLSRDR